MEAEQLDELEAWVKNSYRAVVKTETVLQLIAACRERDALKAEVERHRAETGFNEELFIGWLDDHKTPALLDVDGDVVVVFPPSPIQTEAARYFAAMRPRAALAHHDGGQDDHH